MWCVMRFSGVRWGDLVCDVCGVVVYAWWGSVVCVTAMFNITHYSRLIITIISVTYLIVSCSYTQIVSFEGVFFFFFIFLE